MFTKKTDDTTNPKPSSAPPSPSKTSISAQETRTQRVNTKSMVGSSPNPSILSTDIFVTGNIKSESDIVVKGRVEGDLQAKLIEVGEKAIVKGKIFADELVINGHVKGKIRGVKVRLNSGARVEGDIVHQTIAIESGAHFEGTVKRQENPLDEQKNSPAPVAPASKNKYVPPQQKQPEQKKINP